jgi:hypothetical protein
MRIRQLSRRRFCLLALLAGGVTACGPTLPADVGLKQAGAPIFFGQPTPYPPPPAPPPVALSPFANFPAPLEEPPVFDFHPAPTFAAPPPPACPSAAPDAIISWPVVPTPTSPPVNTAAPYRFRYSGTKTLDLGKQDMHVETLPSSGLRTVSNSGKTTVGAGGPLLNAETSYEFDVTEQFDGKKTVNQYVVYPQGAAGSTLAQQTGQQPAAGIYLKAMTTSNLDDSQSESFTPDPPIELMPLPANTNINSTFESAGTDPQRQGGESMVLPPTPGSAITGDVHVDACGKLLDAWRVTINGFLANTLLANQPTACPAGAAGNTGSPGCTPFTLVLDIGTQYGAISLNDHLTEDGFDTTLNKPFVYDVTATIDEEPTLP